MMTPKVVFDTNILIDYLNGIPQARDTLKTYHVQPAISAITWMEVMVGAKKRAPGQEILTRHFLGQFLLLPVTEAVSEQAVTLRVEHRIKLPDAIIWATAQVDGRQLVTRNPKDFHGQPGVIMPYAL